MIIIFFFLRHWEDEEKKKREMEKWPFFFYLLLLFVCFDISWGGDVIVWELIPIRLVNGLPALLFGVLVSVVDINVTSFLDFCVLFHRRNDVIQTSGMAKVCVTESIAQQ